MSSSKIHLLLAGLAIGALSISACGSDSSDSTKTSNSSSSLSGTIKVDGSSTVTPLMTLAAEDFQNKNENVSVTVGTSGTGGG